MLHLLARQKVLEHLHLVLGRILAIVVFKKLPELLPLLLGTLLLPTKVPSLGAAGLGNASSFFFALHCSALTRLLACLLANASADVVVARPQREG